MGSSIQSVENSGNLEREATATGVDRAGGDQLIVAAHETEDLGEVDAVGVHHRRVDEDLDHLFTVATDLDVEHAGDSLDLLLEVAGDAEQHALAGGARDAEGEDREEGDVDLLDQGLVAIVGQLRLGKVDLLADIDEGLFCIETGVKLHVDALDKLLDGYGLCPDEHPGEGGAA